MNGLQLRTSVRPDGTVCYISKNGSSEGGILPDDVLEWYGLEQKNPKLTATAYATDVNDCGNPNGTIRWTFKMIADMLEDRYIDDKEKVLMNYV